MKRTIKLAVVAALALGATSAFATNGSALIAIGAKARGMGGTQVGVGHGAESGIANPALITTIKGNNEVSFGGTVFMPTIKLSNNIGGSTDFDESASDFFVIPAVSLATKVNDNFYWGIGMWGTGGLGVDFRNAAPASAAAGSHNMVTSLQTMQFGVPLAYSTDGFSIGITPIVQYSALDIHYITGAGTHIGAGTSQDIALGMNLGLAYETDGLTLGATYKSKIKFDVDDVLNNALDGFGVGPNTGGNSNITEMATPSEYGIGVSYTMQGHTLAVDYRNINWEDAEGYKDFGWEDQDVIAIGYEYATDIWAVRCGYQYAESAVQDNDGKALTIDTDFGDNLTNSFNQMGFPGTQETHITVGGSYSFNETLSMDLAAVYGLENKETLPNFVGNTATTEHSEQSYTVQINYAF
ncbi:MAG: outer membrane protein transport protein [Sulfurimonas sp.]|nr:outer membrane protein transport protein [Sulfurimonas sp.]